MPLRGVDDLARTLQQRIPDEVVEAARDAIATGADELVALMKSRVPRDQGALAASIGWSFDGAPEGSISIGEFRGKEFGQIKATIYAGDATTVVYNSRGVAFQNARIQEFGTRGGVPASDYFLGSYKTLRRRIRSRITRNVRAAIKKAYANG